MQYIHRKLESEFIEMNGLFKAILLTGARQVGKTTMLKHLCAGTNRKYVSLDDPLMRQLAREDPRVFLQQYAPPVLIDEVQYAPELFPFIKIACDNSAETGLFWLTGSQHYAILQHVQESLAGRLGILRMLGLAQSEIYGRTDEPQLDFTLQNWQERRKARPAVQSSEIFNQIWTGGMPAIQDATLKNRTRYFSSYVDTYLLRDVADYGSVQDMERYRMFIQACAALVGQQVNYATIADVVGISEPTAKSWTELLEGLGIIYLLRPYANNALKRLAKRSKLYFADTGLAAYLASWPTPETLRFGAASGAFFENFVIMEFVKELAASAPDASFMYYRANSRTEIDLLVEIDRVLHPIEVKQSGAPTRRDINKFEVLDIPGVKRGNGGIVCMVDDPVLIDDRNLFIPCDLI